MTYFSTYLSTNIKLPAIGLGTYQVNDHDVEDLVAKALDLGYRHIESAEGYHNEAGIGRAVQTFLKQGLVRRDGLFVTSKLWSGNAAWGQVPKTYEASIAAFEISLEKLQLDYLDLYLIHAPFKTQDNIEQWRALVHLKKLGRVRYIGVSNFSQSHIESLLAAGLPSPDVNQIELHPWCQRLELVDYLNAHNILPMAYSSLVPLANWRTLPPLDSAKTSQMQRLSKDSQSVINVLANQYQVSQAQLLLRWALELGYAVIPKSLNCDHLIENLELFHFKLDDKTIQLMNSLDLDCPVSWPNGDPLSLG